MCVFALARLFSKFKRLKIFLTILNEEGSNNKFIDLLKKAQNYSLDDQRGRIDSKHLEIPEFLLSHSLIKSHSQQRISNLNDSSNYESASCNFKSYASSNPYYDKAYSNHLNKSTMSLPIATSGFLNISNKKTNNMSNLHDTSVYSQNSTSNTSASQYKPNTVSRSRSPIVIVYDNEDYSLDKTEENLNNISLSEPRSSQSNVSSYMPHQHTLKSPLNYESISEANTPVKSSANSVERVVQLRKPVSVTSLDHEVANSSKNTRISYV